VTNEGDRPVNAVKLQADMVDSFGDVILTIPISENAPLGQGGVDGAVFAFHSPVPPSSIDHVNFAVLAVRFDDGSVWSNADLPQRGPVADQVALRRYPMIYSVLDFWPPTNLHEGDHD
jgi:hypothetical protein